MRSCGPWKSECGPGMFEKMEERMAIDGSKQPVAANNKRRKRLKRRGLVKREGLGEREGKSSQ